MTSSITASAGILLRVSAAPALRVAAPAWLIIAVVVGGFYGESTLTFQELGVLNVESRGLRTTTLVLWALIMAPAARVVVTAQGLDYLRWLPIPRSLVAGQLLGLMAILHGLPVLPLFVAGFPAEGIGMFAALLGIAGCLLPGSRGALEWLIGLLVALALVVLVHRGLWASATASGALAAGWRLPRVWRLAPERSAWLGAPRMVRGGPWRSLFSAQIAIVWRSEAAALSRALLISALGVFLIFMMRRVNQGVVSEGSLIVLSTPPLAAISLMLAIVLGRARRTLAWTMRSLGVRLTRERFASLLLISLAGATLAMTCAWIAAADGIAIGLLAMHVAAWALLALGISSRSRLDVRSASITLAVAIVAMFAIGIGGRVSIGAELGLGFLAAGRVLLREVEDA